MARIEFPWSMDLTLRAQFRLGRGLLLLPVLILAVSALILMRIAIVEFEEIAEEMAH